MERHLQSSIQSRQLTSRLPPFGLPVVGLLCLFSWLATQAFAQGPAATRWRVLWGGGETRDYAGTFALDNGTLQGVKPLGVSSTSNVEVRSVQNRELEIRSHGSQFGGFDVGVAGGPQAQLTLQFQNVDGKGKWVGDHWTLEELLRGPKRSHWMVAAIVA